jgi:hypothetical protein
MASECQGQFSPCYAGSIISNAYSFDATLVDINGNNRCTGIEGILQHLFNHRGWTLNDLTCRYLVGQPIVELFDLPNRHQPDSGMIKT